MTTCESTNVRSDFSSAREKEWDALDNSVKRELVPALEKRLLNPFVPSARLRDGLVGCYKIKLRKQGVRLIYYPDGEKLIITVISVGKRDASHAYQAAQTRL